MMFRDYDCIDSGEGKILEKIGSIYLSRPYAKAIWKKTNPEIWKQCHASFEGNMDGGKGKWIFPKAIPVTPFIIKENKLNFEIKLTPYGHVGLFFEHLTLWPKINFILHNSTPLRILNLFAYTGATSLFLSQKHEVTHVDSSKPVITWAKHNQSLNPELPKSIKWVEEDALKFVQRECKRKSKYDMIILDPPTFGRGPKNEIWQIESNLTHLMAALREILKSTESSMLFTSHTPGMTPVFLEHLLKSVWNKRQINSLDTGELYLNESASGQKLGFGSYCLLRL